MEKCSSEENKRKRPVPEDDKTEKEKNLSMDKHAKRKREQAARKHKRALVKAKRAASSLAKSHEKIARVVPQGELPPVLTAEGEDVKVEVVQKKSTKRNRVSTKYLLETIQRVRPTTHIASLIHYHSTPTTEVETFPKYFTTLADEIQATNGEGLGFAKSTSRLYGLLDGIASFHAAGYSHEDLKPGNIAVTENDSVKIIDFGTAREFVPVGADDSNNTECFRSSKTHVNCSQIDLFAIGCVWVQMLTGDYFKKDDQISDEVAMRAAVSKIYMKFPETEAKLAIDMASTLLAQAPISTAKALLEHPLFERKRSRKQPKGAAGPSPSPI